MPKSNQLTEFERGEIIGLRKADFSLRQIAEILKRSKTAVENTVNDYFKKNKTSAAFRSGRPKKLTDCDNRQVVKAVKKKPKSTLEEMAQNLVELNIVASQLTIRRTLHSEGIYGRKAVKKPFISEIKGMVGVMQENIGKMNGGK